MYNPYNGLINIFDADYLPISESITDSNDSLHTKAYRNFPLLETTDTDLSSLSSGFNIGMTYNLNSSPLNSKNIKAILDKING